VWIHSGQVAEALFWGQVCECACGFGLGEARAFFWNETGAERTVCGFILVKWLRHYSRVRCASAPVGLAWEKQGRFLERDRG